MHTSPSKIKFSILNNVFPFLIKAPAIWFSLTLSESRFGCSGWVGMSQQFLMKNSASFNALFYISTSRVVAQFLSHVQLFVTHGLQHTTLPCPSASPRACSNSCTFSQWCYQPSCPLSSPSPLAFNLSYHQDIFQYHFTDEVTEVQGLNWIIWPPGSRAGFEYGTFSWSSYP